MRRLAVLSLHTSPLAQPGHRGRRRHERLRARASSALARAGVSCDVFTRAWSDDLPADGRHRAGVPGPPRAGRPARARWPRRRCPAWSTSSPTASSSHDHGVGPSAPRGRPLRRRPRQLLAVAASPATRIKHQLDLPLVSTFHTLDRVKAEASPEEVEADAPHRRAEAEAAIIRCSRRRAGLVLGRGRADRRSSTAPTRLASAIVAPGVDHAFFGPGDRPQARRAARPARPTGRCCCSSAGSSP